MFCKTWQKWKDMSYLGNLSAQYENKKSERFPGRREWSIRMHTVLDYVLIYTLYIHVAF